MKMKYFILIMCIAFIFGISVDCTKNKFRILIITPDSNTGYSAGIQQLLEENKIYSEVIEWESAAKDSIRGFDLVIITGKDRFIKDNEVLFGVNKPVLAYGPYGCKYLGKLNLKNGWPYT